MEKSIIATSLRGVFVSESVWEDAHYSWYEQKEKELDRKKLDKTPIIEWRKLLMGNPEKEKKEYFKFVDEIMKTLHPNLSEEDRTKIAREDYFNSVVDFIRENPEEIYRNVIDYFDSIRKEFDIALITTNTKSSLEKIFQLAGIRNGFFKFIECSREDEKDDKISVFERFIRKHGKPVLYVGRGDEAIKYCRDKGINFISTDFRDLSSLKKLKEKIGSLRWD